MKSELIAPCGMNCRLCWGYVRDKNKCPGCRLLYPEDTPKSKYRKKCIIRDCEEIISGRLKYCSSKCDKFPCARLKNLDKRYSTKYGMSMLENLAFIEEQGIRKFIAHEKERWKCPECGEIITVHRKMCMACGCERQSSIK